MVGLAVSRGSERAVRYFPEGGLSAGADAVAGGGCDPRSMGARALRFAVLAGIGSVVLVFAVGAAGSLAGNASKERTAHQGLKAPALRLGGRAHGVRLRRAR